MYQKKLFKVSGFALAICLMATTALLGCSKTGGSKDSGTTSSTEKVKVSIMTRWKGADPMAAVYEQMVKDYESQHPNVTIEDSSISEEASYNNKLKSAIATGTLPDIFFYTGVASIVQWAKTGVIMDITPLMEDKSWSDGFVDGSFEVWNLEKYGIKGHYTIPTLFNPEVMYYNTELFAKAGITKIPETMDDLYSAIDKLKAINVIPFGLGAKDTWRTGHLFTNILYRQVGVEKVKDLGTRNAKWTDPDVVKSLAIVKDLVTKGAFEKGFQGIDYNTEESEFLSGKSAIMCNGSWEINPIIGANSQVKDKIKFFPFPYFADKPQFKSDSVIFTTGLKLSGTMKGAEKAAAIDFVKYLTNKDSQTKWMSAGVIGSRKDVVAPNNASQLLKDMVTNMSTIKVPGGDYFDYDPDPALTDKSRNEIMNMLLKNTPEQTAKNIQDEIVNFTKGNQ